MLRLVLDDRRVVLHLDVRERVRAAAIPDEHRVALRVVARALGLRQHLHLAAIRLFPLPAEMPFETIVDFVFRPMWIIFVPVSACCWLFTTATE